MQSDLSDEDLRSLLSKYMDTVPPVTDTTRTVLLSKLEKFLLEDIQPEVSDNTTIDNLSANSLQTSPVKSLRLTPNKKTERPIISLGLSDQVVTTPSQTAAFASTTAPTAPEVSISFESPRDKSSPVLEYLSRMPTYRRRSIHPNRPGLASPYADFYLPDAPIIGSTAPYRSLRQQIRHAAMDGLSASGKAAAWLSIPVTQTGSLFGVLRSFVAGFGTQLRKCSGPSRVSIKWAVCLLLIGLFVLLVTSLLYGDPFYNNPVNELRSFWNSQRI